MTFSDMLSSLSTTSANGRFQVRDLTRLPLANTEVAFCVGRLRASWLFQSSMALSANSRALSVACKL